MVVIDRCLLYKNTVSNNPLIKWSLCTGFLKKLACQIWRENYLGGQNQPFTKFVEAANNLTKLIEVGKKFTKLLKFANNFTKLVGLASNFCKVCKTCKNFMTFVYWKVRFKCLKVFLYWSFTWSNISIGKHKCFMKTFHVS